MKVHKFSKVPVLSKDKNKKLEEFLNVDKKGSKKKVMYIRVSQKTYDEIQELIMITQRSMNSVCNDLLRKSLSAMRKQTEDLED